MGLDWHQEAKDSEDYTHGKCSCGDIMDALCGDKLDVHISYLNPDPLDPADMYGKIWVAFKKHKAYDTFIIEIFGEREGLVEAKWLMADLFTDAELLNRIMLGYFKEGETDK